MTHKALKTVGDLTCAIPYVALTLFILLTDERGDYGGKMALMICVYVPLILLSCPWSFAWEGIDWFALQGLPHEHRDGLRLIVASSGVMLNAYIIARLTSAKWVAAILLLIGLIGWLAKGVLS